MKYLLMAACMAASAAAGCHSGPGQIVEGEHYPDKVERGPTLNIQVFRRATQLEFTNTTASPIPASRLWLNAWFSRDLEPLGVGESVVIPLREFKDRFGESFRGGGFFATEIPDRLALAEVQMDGKMVGLVVVGGE